MATATRAPSTLDDLARVSGKAELVGGRILTIMPSGDAPSEAAFEIAVSLRAYARACGAGVAYPNGVGHTLCQALPSGRQSFSPDASHHIGPRPKNRMKLLEGAPVFAVEVRGEHDYGPKAESDMAAKRADYFAAGSWVVWDVDPIGATIASYRHDDPTTPVVFRAGQIADAEPAVPGWTFPVNDLQP